MLKMVSIIQQGVELQSYYNKLVKCIEELCTKREELSWQIQQEEKEKGKLQGNLCVLTEHLAYINETLAHKMASCNEFDKTIAETEVAYMKILESLQTLLNVLKKEARNLAKAPESKSFPAKDR
ncbi:putative Sjogren syndrome nuclear autoantigen 1 protein [Naja naja]|nr:putative Sjogren syndrome nuclear autoantigen 1 protein [Naja naja]